MEKKSIVSHKYFFLFLGLAVFLGFYFIFDPLQSIFMPQCIFHKVTGLQCMGCGSQRMIHALLHGDLQAAFHANAFLFCSLPFLGVLIVVEINRKKWPKLYASIHSLAVIITITAMLVAWLFIRNFLGI